MARSKSDISNSAIRIFLQNVGAFYDEKRGLNKFVTTKSQKEELIAYFNGRCCYCGRGIAASDLYQDHLVPVNQYSLGLHAWGNVVPCYNDCNSAKQQQDWQVFLKSKAQGETFRQRASKISQFVQDKKYDPNLNLTEYAGNLYEDVGVIAMTLIELRPGQAREAIERLLK
ncbi:HNH endonuclease [Chloroflexota bacterium]